jgi:hypothetical protein
MMKSRAKGAFKSADFLGSVKEKKSRSLRSGPFLVSFFDYLAPLLTD